MAVDKVVVKHVMYRFNAREYSLNRHFLVPISRQGHVLLHSFYGGRIAI